MWFPPGRQLKDHRFVFQNASTGVKPALASLSDATAVRTPRGWGGAALRAFPRWNYQIPVAKLLTLPTSPVNSCCGLTSRRWYSNQPPLAAPRLPWPRGQLLSVLLGLVLTTRCCAFTARPEHPNPRASQRYSPYSLPMWIHETCLRLLTTVIYV